MSEKIRLLYIAGPYRATNGFSVEDNVDAAEELAGAVMMAAARVLPIVPHSIGYRYAHLIAEGGDESFWLPATMALMERCDAVLMTSGWTRSRGATAERVRALEMGLPVFETVDAVMAWADAPALVEIGAILSQKEGEPVVEAARRVVAERDAARAKVADLELAVWQRDVTDGAPVLPGASANPDDDAYIILDGDGGIEYAATEAEAIKAAEAVIGDYRDEALNDGWHDDVEGILVARVIARAAVVSREPSEDDEVDAVEYGMRRVEVSHG